MLCMATPQSTDVAAPVGHDVGDGSAAALVDFTEFADLQGTSFSLKMRRILDMNSALASLLPPFPRAPVYLHRQMP